MTKPFNPCDRNVMARFFIKYKTHVLYFISRKLKNLLTKTLESASEDAPQRILWGPVGMGLGIAYYFCLEIEPSLLLSLFLFLISITLFIIYRNHPWGRFIVWPVLAFQLGYCAIQGRVAYLDTQMLTHRLNKVEIVGEVEQIEIKEGKKRLILKNITTLNGTSSLQASARLMVPKKEKMPELGDRVRLIATLFPLSAPLLPNTYDHRRASFFQGIGATGWVNEIQQIYPWEPPFRLKGAWTWLQRLRQFINHQLLQLVPGESGAIAVALVTGERGYIHDDIRQAYTDAGIAHILAISGLHLSLIAGIIFMILRRGLSLSLTLGEKYNLKKVASLTTIPFLLIYLLISGMGVPAIRSFIMVSIVMLAVILDRRAISMRLLALAAFIILLIQPESLLSASFALSFAAVIGLVSIYQGGWIPFHNWVLEGGRFRRIIAYILGIIITTLIASAVTTPISMYIFNRLSLQAILGNLIGIPLTGFVIMPSLLILVLSLPFGGIQFVGSIASKAIDWLTQSSIYIAHLPGAAIPIPQVSALFIWLFVLGCLWLLLWRQPWRHWGYIPIFCSFLVFSIPTKPMILVNTKGYIAWYDGQSIYNFMDHGDPFCEDILKRHFGTTSIKDIENSQISLELGGSSVLLINEHSNLKKRNIFQNYDLIITRYPLKQRYWSNELAQVIELTSSHSRRKRGTGLKDNLYILFTSTGYEVLQGRSFQGERPWSVPKDLDFLTNNGLF